MRSNKRRDPHDRKGGDGIQDLMIQYHCDRDKQDDQPPVCTMCLFLISR